MPLPVSEAEIRDWCLACLARTIDYPATPIAADKSFAEMGLDSATAVYFTIELEEWLGCELEPELVGDYPTVDRLAQHLAGRLGAG